MEKQLRILIVEDSPENVSLITHLLKEEDITFVSRVVDSKEDYQEELEKFIPDIIISNHSVPQVDSMEALKIFLQFKNSLNRSAAFVLVINTVYEEFAVKVIQSGADDYILKDRLKRLPSAILNSVEKNRMKEQKRKEEEEKLHFLEIFQKSLHEIFVIDPETLRFIYVNEQGLRNLGYSKEEIWEMTPFEILYEFNEERFRKILSKVIKRKKGMIFERYAVRKNKTRYPIQIHLELIQHGSKKVALTNCLDISEEKETEKQREIALFIQNSFTEDKDLEASLNIILEEFCNRSSVPAAEIWGRDFGEISRRYAGWKNIGYPDPEVGKLFAEKVFATGVSVNCEDFRDQNLFKKENLHKENHYNGAVAYPIRSGNEITAVLIFFIQEIVEERDLFIDLREGVQDKLASNIKRKKTEEELQKIFEISPDILAILGKDGYFKKVNPALKRILGYCEEEWATLSFNELLHPDDLYLLEEWKNRVMKENEIAHYESRWLTKTGKYKWFSWSVTPFLEEGLNLGIGKDITQNKKQLESINNKNLKLADIAWQQSHTVRGPLTRLMACIAYLEENDEKKDIVLECIKNSAYELDGIIKEIVCKTDHVTQDDED